MIAGLHTARCTNLQAGFRPRVRSSLLLSVSHRPPPLQPPAPEVVHVLGGPRQRAERHV